jgi:hypothetical protein
MFIKIILSHQGNANQNYIEILSHSSQNGYHQNNKQQQQILIHCRLESKLALPYGNQY